MSISKISYNFYGRRMFSLHHWSHVKYRLNICIFVYAMKIKYAEKWGKVSLKRKGNLLDWALWVIGNESTYRIKKFIEFFLSNWHSIEIALSRACLTILMFKFTRNIIKFQEKSNIHGDSFSFVGMFVSYIRKQCKAV